jgi:large subunit ribosomal protein L25
LPQFIEVDLENLELGHSIHLSEIKVPEGVELTALTHDNDAAITSIVKPKVQAVEEPVAAANEEGEESTGTEEEGSSEENSGDESQEG